MKKSSAAVAAMLALSEMEIVATHRGDDMWGVVTLRAAHPANQAMVARL